MLSLPLEGCRILNKNLATDALNYAGKGYQLEVLLNEYLIKQKSKVEFFYISADSLPKYKKEIFILGFIKEIFMWTQIFSAVGIKKLYQQSLWVRKLRTNY